MTKVTNPGWSKRKRTAMGGCNCSAPMMTQGNIPIRPINFSDLRSTRWVALVVSARLTKLDPLVIQSREDLAGLLLITLAGQLQAETKGSRRLPAQRFQPRNVQQFAESAVRLAGVK